MTWFDGFGRISGKDKDLPFPEQQGKVLGKVGNMVIVFPYGLYADLPNKSWFKKLFTPDGNIVIPFTTKRPQDTEQGEPVFFHPETNTRIIARNNKDLEIITGDGTKGNVIIKTVQAKIIATELVEIDAPNTIVKQNFQVLGNTDLGNVTSNGKDISDGHSHNGVEPGSGNSGDVN